MRLPRLPLWAWALAGIVIVVGLNGVAWLPSFTTSGPPYCLSCHGTGETPDVSQPSLVHPDYGRVGCTDCHAEPGGIIIKEGYRGGYYADPERVSANCLRCHQGIVSDQQEGFKYNTLRIRIPHRLHVEGAGVRCTDCHRNIAHDFRPVPSNRPRMEYCASCHRGADLARAGTSGEACTKCHGAG